MDIFLKFKNNNFTMFFLAITAGLFLGGCATGQPAQSEYSKARVAIDAAKTVDAPRFDPGNWHQAMVEYQTGEKEFKAENYEAASRAFKKSQELAEKAENNTIILRAKSGEVL